MLYGFGLSLLFGLQNCRYEATGRRWLFGGAGELTPTGAISVAAGSGAADGGPPAVGVGCAARTLGRLGRAVLAGAARVVARAAESAVDRGRGVRERLASLEEWRAGDER